jgi:putative hemolysin
VAQVAQSSVLHEYRYLNVAVALWATVLRYASALGIQCFFAEVHLESNSFRHGDTGRVSDHPEIRCTARHMPRQPAGECDDTQSPVDSDLPAIAKLFFRLGGRVCGSSQYQPSVKSYSTPFVWHLDELAELHMSLLRRLPDFEAGGLLSEALE